MGRILRGLLPAALLALSVVPVRAQEAQSLIQQVVDAEHNADLNDHSQWIYLEQSTKPHERLLQWVAMTPKGNVRRVMEKNSQALGDGEQRSQIQDFLHDTRAQKKQAAENSHDNQQVDDLLRLLPVAFVWTVTGRTKTTTSLHFEPAPNFKPPTREARVFSAMSGNLVADNEQHRVLSISGQLTREVTFGGGLLGRLKPGSTFALEQVQVAPYLWQLSAIHVHLVGTALLFKSVSLEEDDLRSQFEREAETVSLETAASAVMVRPPAGTGVARK